jgi:hypothetical protein
MMMLFTLALIVLLVFCAVVGNGEQLAMMIKPSDDLKAKKK